MCAFRERVAPAPRVFARVGIRAVGAPACVRAGGSGVLDGSRAAPPRPVVPLEVPVAPSAPTVGIFGGGFCSGGVTEERVPLAAAAPSAATLPGLGGLGTLTGVTGVGGTGAGTVAVMVDIGTDAVGAMDVTV